MYWRDMHIVNALITCINGKNMKRSANRLARTEGILAVRSTTQAFVGPS